MKKFLPIAVIIIIGIGITYTFFTKPAPLPVFNPADLNPDLVDSSLRAMDKKHRVGDFDLIDQDGEIVTATDFNEKIYVADFFFVTCPTICPKMTGHMKEVYDEFKDEERLLLLSHTVMPEKDSVSVLKEYAQDLGVPTERWKFVTGAKKQIYHLARKVYFAAVTEGDGGVDDFIHTENLILVDKQKRLRGFYDGTSDADTERLIKDIHQLLDEEE